MGFLITTVLILFAINCIFLIFLVMVQTGKGGGGVGGMLGGGSSGSVFGASTADVMTKITRGAAIVFIFLALVLSFLFAKKDDTLIPENSLNPTWESTTESSEGTNTKEESPVDSKKESPQGE